MAIELEDLQNRIAAYANLAQRVDAAGRHLLSSSPQTHATSLCQDITFTRFARIVTILAEDDIALILKVRSGRVFAIKNDPQDWIVLDGTAGQNQLKDALIAVVQSAGALYVATARWTDPPRDGATGVLVPAASDLCAVTPASIDGAAVARLDLVAGQWRAAHGQPKDIARLQALAQTQLVIDWLLQDQEGRLIFGGVQNALIDKTGITLLAA